MPKLIDVLSTSFEVSSTRVAFLLWTTGTFMVWLVVSYEQKKVAELPDSVVAMVSALTAAKALQTFAEVWKSLSVSEKGKEAGLEALMYVLDENNH